ncbi:MAG: hypothetical protein ABL883_04645 [Terricaulis sp.]
MRSTLALASLAAFFAFSFPANAAPVNLSPVSFSPEFQTALDDDLGAREGERLQADLVRAVTRELAARGATIGEGGVTVELSIIDADPNRPTWQQMTNRPGLDYIRSISLGGADLRAILRGADGQVVSEVTHRRYDYNIEDAAVQGATTWSAAQRAIRGFAQRVADAYMAAQ